MKRISTEALKNELNKIRNIWTRNRAELEAMGEVKPSQFRRSDYNIKSAKAEVARLKALVKKNQQLITSVKKELRAMFEAQKPQTFKPTKDKSLTEMTYESVRDKLTLVVDNVSRETLSKEEKRKRHREAQKRYREARSKRRPTKLEVERIRAAEFFKGATDDEVYDRFVQDIRRQRDNIYHGYMNTTFNSILESMREIKQNMDSKQLRIYIENLYKWYEIDTYLQSEEVEDLDARLQAYLASLGINQVLDFSIDDDIEEYTSESDIFELLGITKG